MLSTETSNSESDIGVAKSKDEVSGWRDFGFNLCVVPFPNIYASNFKLEDLHQSYLEVVQSGQKFGGLDVLTEVDLIFELVNVTMDCNYLNGILVLMSNGRVEARTGEQEY